ncbi:hypothetical protein FLAG1_07272 [Fusarium langsethiae]|uniref:Uncharacterized protein n=1 Tax=Fusarium langsethiae TaxID=179993 RepID=A0A0M9ETY9_FUSLA|nr:hypothetical protein FLAG1_07272 [Fusarium langsethiae]GKU04650.1 unnamed protein product [Fusarium langsethiae]GKU20136.1 unnamed protein product [Fusarium langsethiae]
MLRNTAGKMPLVQQIDHLALLPSCSNHPPPSYPQDSLHISTSRVLMANKPTSLPTTHTTSEPPTMTAEKSSSGFVKLCAFIDAVAKLLIAGALIGILVVLVQLSNSIDNNIKGRGSFSVRVSDSNPLRIVPAYSQYFTVNMQSSVSSPLYFKAVN